MGYPKMTDPGFYTDPVPIGNDLKPKVPSTQIAGDLGEKYGDVQTAKVNGLVSALRAAVAPTPGQAWGGFSGIKRTK